MTKYSMGIIIAHSSSENGKAALVGILVQLLPTHKEEQLLMLNTRLIPYIKYFLVTIS